MPRFVSGNALFASVFACLAACGGGGDGPSGDGDGDAETPPETTLSGGLLSAALPYAHFEFSSDDPGTFECSVDGSAYEPCTSPVTINDLAFGDAHTFAVRAINEADKVDSSPAEISFTRTAVQYTTLSETGLFNDIPSFTFGPLLREFAPTHELWVDGAHKRRFIRLPPGTQIDTSNMDRWNYPEGTQFFKEFRTPDGQLIETRLIEHRSANNGNSTDRPELWVGSFVWRDDLSDADFVPNGAINPRGFGYDVPGSFDCYDCHRGQPDWGLGFTAVQLSRTGAPGETTLTSLADEGLLTDPPPAGETYPIPGNATEQAALGFYHSNCSHCHSPLGRGFDFVDMNLMVLTGERTVTGTNLYQTTVNQPLTFFDGPPGVNNRIQPGNAAASGTYYRASQRGNSNQMPPNDSSAFFGSIRVTYTDIVPTARLQAVQQWINSL